MTKTPELSAPSRAIWLRLRFMIRIARVANHQWFEAGGGGNLGSATSAWPSLITALASFGVWAVFCDDARCAVRFSSVRVMPILSLSCLSWWCVSVLKERAKCRASTFWGIQFIRYLVILMHLKSERAARPLGIKVSWGVSSEEGGAAHGPLHPALLSSKLLAF